MSMLSARRIVTALAALALATGIASGLSACSSTGITAERLDHAIGPAFSRVYVVQQHRLGRIAAVVPGRSAACRRSDVHSPRRGAGDDWTCTLNYPFADGHVQPITYDVHVQATGCYTASGPTQVVGPQHQTGTDGSVVTNALFEFDGCFDVT